MKRVNPRGIALGQGLFFVAAGLWPVADIRSFERVTGPKQDDWLVKTVGLLIAVTGGALLASAARSRKPPPELALAAAGQSIALGGVSLYYSLRGTISKVYLADAVTEAGIATLWALSARRLSQVAA
jgi:hypothetical protein